MVNGNTDGRAMDLCMIYKETEHLQSKSSIQLKEQSEPYPAIGK